MKLRVMSMNLRNSGAHDGRNIWKNRKGLVQEILHAYQPDVIGFQEALLDQMRDVIAMLPEYQHVGVAREDGKEDGEFNPIFYKNLRVDQSGTFWLSDTPEIPSCTWGGLTRICTWIVVAAPLPFAFLNTHVDHTSIQAQLNSMNLLITTAKTYAARMPVVLVGDFNYHPDSDPYSRLSAYMRDSYREDLANTDDLYVTFHDFTGIQTVNEHSNEGRIDYVWFTGDVKVERSWIVFDRPGSDPDLYPSDHWPIACDLMFGHEA